MHTPTEIRLLLRDELDHAMPRLEAFVARSEERSLSRHPGWLTVFERAFGHRPYCLEAVRNAETVGLLPLAFVRSRLFGRFLVGMPYLNVGGLMSDDDQARIGLIDRAVTLAEQLDVKHLELRHETPIEHLALGERLTGKVHMRLELPDSTDALWKSFKPKVRNQIRKGEQFELSVDWGGKRLLGEFYRVFSHNMRDLGTPVFGRKLFEAILEQFPDRAELCVVRSGKRPIAGAILIHGPGITEVPSASSLRKFNSTNANMLMYWHLLCRAVERGQPIFDFGRSTEASNTFRFKKQWGAQPHQAVWQYHVLHGTLGEMRPDHPRYQRMIRLWKRLPVPISRVIGPVIVRGIP